MFWVCIQTLKYEAKLQWKCLFTSSATRSQACLVPFRHSKPSFFKKSCRFYKEWLASPCIAGKQHKAWLHILMFVYKLKTHLRAANHQIPSSLWLLIAPVTWASSCCIQRLPHSGQNGYNFYIVTPFSTSVLFPSFPVVLSISSFLAYLS